MHASRSSGSTDSTSSTGSTMGLAALTPTTADELWELLHPRRQDAGRQSTRHLGQALIAHNLITHAQLQTALQAQQQQARNGQHQQLGQLLVEAGVLSQEQLRSEISAWLGQYTVNPCALPPDPSALALVPRTTAEQAQVLPLMLRDDAAVVLMQDVENRHILDQLRFLTQRRVIAVQAAPDTLARAIQRAYRVGGSGGSINNGASRASARDLAQDLGNSHEVLPVERADIVSESDNTLVRLVHSVIEEAIAQGASDIHIETNPAPHNVRIRLRVDGDLHPYLDLQARFRFALVARLKIMAELDISERRKPQDGKIDFSRFGGPKVELRVVTIPTTQGLEDVVLRLLASHKPLPLEHIGLSPQHLDKLRAVVRKSYGLILVCGPTGSGKTTTLHSIIREINTTARKIWTAENPIEITQEGLRQVEVNPRIGWTFAAAMRSFLRADPDVVMIGEMRDEETASIAVEASLTGHLVLSTLHTNSAPESIARLLEMGMDPFTFSDSLLAILAQRLVRRLCEQCRAPEPATVEALRTLAEQYLSHDPQVHTSASAANQAQTLQIAAWLQELRQRSPQGQPTLWRRVGCDHCDGSGYKGRMGIHELMLSDDTIRDHIRKHACAHDIRASALRAGMKTLRQDGIEKVLQGLTDMSEVLAVSNI